MNRERLAEAAAEHGARLELRDGKTQLVWETRTGLSSAEQEQLAKSVKHTYSVLTVKVGLASAGFKVMNKAQTKTLAGSRTKLTVGK